MEQYKDSKIDQIIIASAAICFVVLSYFLYNDSWLHSDNHTKDLIKIGNISTNGDDVRRKNILSFIWLPIDKLDSVYQGDSLFTGSQGQAHILTADGSRLYVQPNSLLVLNLKNGSIDLDLKFGQLAGEISDTSKLSLKSGKETLQLTGTGASKIRLNRRVDGSTQIRVLDGKAKLLTKNKAVDIKKDEGLMLSASGEVKNSDSYEFLDPLAPNDTLHIQPNSPLNLTWSGSGDAHSFAIETSKESDFSQIESTYKTQLGPLAVKNLPTINPFYWRVKAFNKQQKLMATSSVGKIQYIVLQPPTISEPKQNTIYKITRDPVTDELTSSSQAQLRWISSIQNDRYQLELSDSPDFNSIINTYESSELSLQTEPLDAGVYFARVRGLNSTHPNTPWSAATKFTIEIESPDTELTAPLLSLEKMEFKPTPNKAPEFSWSPVTGASEYELQISQDEQFNSPKVSLKTKTNSVKWQKYESGQFFYRARAISKKARPGPYSTAGALDIPMQKPVLAKITPPTAQGTRWDDPGSPVTIPAQWSAVPGANSYKIEMATQDDFANPTSTIVKSPASTLNLPQGGEYFVRVTALSKQGESIGETSEVVKLVYRVVNPLKAPDLKEPLDSMTFFLQVDDDPYISFEWNEVPHASKYKVEASLRPDFSDAFLKDTTNSAKYLVKTKLPKGKIYWRVQAINDEGSSKWSATRHFLLYSSTADIPD